MSAKGFANELVFELTFERENERKRGREKEGEGDREREKERGSQKKRIRCCVRF